jgi:hypothetical protein
MRRVFRRGSMGRQHSIPPGDAPGDDRDVAKIPTLKPALRESAKCVPKLVTDGAPSPQPALTDTQVLRVLENRRAPSDSPTDVAIGGYIAVLPPEDTNTRLVLREAVARNAPVSFSVQLRWSVQPIDVKSVPRHPIFHAYTLYAAEGRRAGRTWFFLRLGFFKDAVSAKQVAQYLRSDFASAAVVPVSSQERQQVKQTGRCAESGTVARRPGRARQT